MALLDMFRVKLGVLIMIARFRVRAVRHAVVWALHARPIAGGAPDDDTADDENDDVDDKDDEADKDPADDKADDVDDADTKPAAGEPNWKQMARKHEREAKKARREREQIEQRLRAREDADKSEQEKAIEEAEARARTETESKYEKERRHDRLELAATKIAAKGLKIGRGDDSKTLRFADPDDALVYLERDISNGDLDPEDIFDENGKVRVGQLQDALTDLLSRKPHLAADGQSRKVAGSADAGKGEATKPESSVEDELKKIRRHKQAA